METVKRLFQQHGKLMLLTFEVFWIVIFLLDRVSGTGTGGGVPQFVYVNF